MKTNLPVTQHEIPFPQGSILVSKTDLKGIITEANEAFVKLSGFYRDELIGMNHNLVRHPDMPTQAFEDLWKTVSQGKPWRGLVKNRAKNGDFYWVDAFVVPVRKGGVITGYMSVRTEPLREQIRAAELLYSGLKNSDQPLRTEPRFARLWNVRTRMAATMLISVLMVILAAFFGMRGIKSSNQMLTDSYQGYFEPVLELNQSMQLMDGAFKHASLSFEHEPDSHLARSQDHALNKHTDKISAKISELEKIKAKLESRQFNAEERRLLDDFISSENIYIEKGLRPAHELIRSGHFAEAHVVLDEKIAPLYDAAKEKALMLEQHLNKKGQALKISAADNYDATLTFNLVCVLLSLLIMLGVSQLQARAVLRPIREVINAFSRIGEGILTDEPDLSRHDEFGELNAALAVMQVRLKAMLDEILMASLSLQQHSANLDAQMYMVVTQSDVQNDRVMEAAAGAEQSSQSVAEVAEQAIRMSESALSSDELVAQSSLSMQQSMSANQKVAQAVTASGEVIVDLSQRIDNINSITVSIKKIADQTNLLALNAAIEAARAGESGRGFAVVADEVHKLAVRTAKSTLDITAMVAEIRGVASGAVQKMELATQEVHAGIEQMGASVEGLNRVAEAGRLVLSGAQHISEFAREQAQTSTQMAANMQDISMLVEQNARLAKDASGLSHDLHETSELMRRVINTFELHKNGPVSTTSSAKGDINLF